MIVIVRPSLEITRRAVPNTRPACESTASNEPVANGSDVPSAGVATTVAGTVVSIASIGFGAYLVARRILFGPEAEGLFTLFAILFLLLGGNFLALGVLGEYVSRIHVQVQRRPRSVVAETINVERPAAP